MAVDAIDERMRLEQGLIALLASRKHIPIEDQWLGRWAARSAVRETRMWNLEHVDATPLTYEELPLLTKAISRTLVESGSPDVIP
jgi:hypothetical protein